MNKMYRLLAFLTIVLLGGFGINAQSIKGTIKDVETGAAIPGASVTIEGRSAGTATDGSGMYNLRVSAGTYKLKVSSVGYTTNTITVTVGSEGITQDIVLTQSNASLNEVIVTGTRSGGRVKTESPVPVDIINVKELTTQSPQNNLTQILNSVAPSFTSNSTTVADGTDHIDPAQLRGLGPDQVLVLLNGKRRHTSSLVNVNGSPGRGSVGTDLNAIPAFAIDKIEVLRDGAAAQYGSDAIAGIVNVGMKKATGKLELALYSGANFSSGANNHKGGVDGAKHQIDANYGFNVGKKGGFINITASGTIRDATSRAKTATDQIFNGYNAVEYQAQKGGYDLNKLFTDVNAIKQFGAAVPYFDNATKGAISAATTISDLQKALNINVSDQEIALRGISRDDFNMKVGQSTLQSGQLFVNSAFPINKDHEIYAFGGYGSRQGDASGFYRRPSQNRTYTPLFINGFLPTIQSNITDGSFAAGIRGVLGKYNYDFSNTFGTNSFDYTIKNTTNATMLGKSPTSFNAGGLQFSQNTINLDFSRKFDFLQGLNVAFGAEGRFESYRIKAGEQNSWANYDASGNLITASTQITSKDFFGNTRPGGSQVFAGFKPISAAATSDANRQSMAIYVDGELDITNKFLAEAAIRFENYSDFGSVSIFKLASRYKLTDNINIRAAASTGFRAPSLAQIYYNSTSTLFNNGVPNEVGTFTNTSQAANLLGIPKLKQEESQSVSAGFTAKVPAANLTITADAYLVRINDRVVLTDNFSRPSGVQTGSGLALQQIFDQAYATAANFFTNAINTESRGLDIVITHRANLGSGIKLRNDLAGTLSKTIDVGGIKASDILAQNGQINNYFSEASRVYVEEAIPRVKFNLSNNLTVGKFDFFMRNGYFGEVTDPNVVDVNGDGKISAIVVNGKAVENEHPIWGAKIITDLSFGYAINNSTKLVVGANNLFDIYPDMNYGPVSAKRPSGVGSDGSILYANAASTIDLSNSNQFVYSRNTSQFGQNGRFLFARLNLSF